MKAKSLAILLLVGSAMANTQKSVIHLNLVAPDAKAAAPAAKADAEAPASDPKAEKDEAVKEAEADASKVKPLRYATNGKLIPGPFGKVEKDDPEMEEPEVNTENGLAKAKKPLTRAEKAEAEDLKEHPEKMCESLKKSPKGEEVTKQEKVNDPAPMYEKPADLPRKKKPVKAKVPAAGAAGAAAAGGAAAVPPAAAKAVEAKKEFPSPAPVATVKNITSNATLNANVTVNSTAKATTMVEPKKKVNLMIHGEDDLNKVTGKKDKIPKFMDDVQTESFVQKQLKK